MADFTVEDHGGVLILRSNSTMAHNALGKVYSASRDCPTTQAAIRELAEAGFTFEGDIPHD